MMPVNVILLKRFPRLVSVSFLFVLMLMVTAAVITPHAYAIYLIPGQHPVISPNPGVAGQPIYFRGSGIGTVGSTITLEVYMDTSSAHDCSSTSTATIATDTTSIAPGPVYTFVETMSTPGYYCARVMLGSGMGAGISHVQPFSVTSPASQPPSQPNVIIMYQTTTTTETNTASNTMFSTITQVSTATFIQSITQTTTRVSTVGLAPGLDPSANTLLLALVFLLGALAGFLILGVLRKKQKPFCSKCGMFKLVGVNCVGCGKPEANCSCRA